MAPLKRDPLLNQRVAGLSPAQGIRYRRWRYHECDHSRTLVGARRAASVRGRAVGVHHAVRLDADDGAGRERLTHYMLRCPFSLERMIRVTDLGTVIYLAEKKACRRFPKPAGGASSATPRGSHATSRSSTLWISSPNSPSISPTPDGTSLGTSGSTCRTAAPRAISAGLASRTAHGFLPTLLGRCFTMFRLARTWLTPATVNRRPRPVRYPSALRISTICRSV